MRGSLVVQTTGYAHTHTPSGTHSSTIEESTLCRLPETLVLPVYLSQPGFGTRVPTNTQVVLTNNAAQP